MIPGRLTRRLLSRHAANLLARNTIVSCGIFAFDIALLWGLVELGMGKIAAAALAFVVANSIHYVFGRGWIYFKPWRVHRRMPILVANALCALFVWLAENIGTFVRAWSYPAQLRAWSMVGVSKYGSWFLLLVISYAIVAAALRPQRYEPQG